MRVDRTPWSRLGERARRSLPLLLTLLIGLSGLTLVVLPKFLSPAAVESLNLGALVREDIRAPRAIEIEDEETTAWTRSQAETQVRSLYDHDGELAQRLPARVGDVFTSLPGLSVDVAKSEIVRRLGVQLDSDEVAELLTHGDDMRRRASECLHLALSGYVVTGKDVLLPDVSRGIIVRHLGGLQREEAVTDLRDIADLASARQTMIDYLRDNAVPRPERRVLLQIVEGVLKPTLTFNRDETERRRLQAASLVRPVRIPVAQGELIARAGDRLTARQALILKGLEAEAQRGKSLPRALATTLLLATMALASLRFSRGLSRRPLRLRDGVFAISVLIAQMLMVRVHHFALGFWDPSFVAPYDAVLWAAPFATGPLVMRLFLAEQVGLVVGLVSAVAASLMFDASLPLLLYVLAGSLIAATSSRRRLSFLRTGLEIWLAQGAVAVCLVMLEAAPRALETAWLLGAALVSAVGTVVICALATPAIEAVFGFTTELRLRELATLNHPLLKQLIVAAPGTYHHSVVMGQMVEAAAEAVGADPLLAKVGAYFHDVGKLDRPQIYAENRRDGETDVGPSEADVELMAHHVEHGLELLGKARLGRALAKLVSAHHGTRAIGRGGQSAHHYPGPVPESKEAALVMLADCVETATRNGRPAKPADLVRIVDQVVEELFLDEQLSACELPFSALPRIKAAFVSTLLRVRQARDGQQLWVVHESGASQRRHQTKL